MSPRTPPLDRWLLSHRRAALALAGVLFASVLLCWVVIQVRGSFPGDGKFVSWLLFPQPAEPFAFCSEVFSAIADPLVAFVSVAAAWVIVDQWLGSRSGLLVPAAVAAVAVNWLLKVMLGPTPLQVSIRGPDVFGNFPSGHVVYITSLCGLLGWFALARGKRWIFLVLLVAVLGMGPFRVVSGSHWPSDVLAGYALGLGWTIVVLVVGLPWAAAQPPVGSGTDGRGRRELTSDR